MKLLTAYGSHARTGLPSASRDVSGIETALEYDALGRLTWEEPASGHGAWVEYQYTAATSAAALAKVLIRRRANGSKTAAVLAQEEYQFDGLGRVAKERRQMPALDWVARDTTYDAMGHVSTVSKWYDESEAGTPAVTQYLGYDAFGRPTTIRPPAMDPSPPTSTVGRATSSRFPRVTDSSVSTSHRFPRVTDCAGSTSHRFP